MDQDPAAIEELNRFAAERGEHDPRIDVVHGNFAELSSCLKRLGVEEVDGVLADLGVSSPQLDRAERGFSFQREGPLDMRMDPSAGPSAADVVAQVDEKELARIFWEYGEERFSRRVAARIARQRRDKPFRTTLELADAVRAAIPGGGRRHGGGPKIDPATRVFQALRIYVNDELGALETLLETLPLRLRSGGRAVVISFHSLEDRRVKQAFREPWWTALTKKPVQADEEEARENPRSRSAKLRAAQRVPKENTRP
jgi:16S rRNA (cytosine1402-N4)-methyltransferase